MVAAKSPYSFMALAKLQSIRDAEMKEQAGQPNPPPMSEQIPQQLAQLESGQPMQQPMQQQPMQQQPMQQQPQQQGIASIGGEATGAGGGMVSFTDGGGVRRFAAGGVKDSPFMVTFNDALEKEGVIGTSLEPVVRSLFQQESSSGANTKTSNAGAVGAMQILPTTFASVADKDWDIKDPSQNIRAGIRYAGQMFKLADGDPSLTAAGYYGGPRGLAKAREGIALPDQRNPNAPNTLQYGQQVANRIPVAENQTPRARIPDRQLTTAENVLGYLTGSGSAYGETPNSEVNTTGTPAGRFLGDTWKGIKKDFDDSKKRQAAEDKIRGQYGPAAGPLGLFMNQSDEQRAAAQAAIADVNKRSGDSNAGITSVGPMSFDIKTLRKNVEDQKKRTAAPAVPAVVTSASETQEFPAPLDPALRGIYDLRDQQNAAISDVGRATEELQAAANKRIEDSKFDIKKYDLALGNTKTESAAILKGYETLFPNPNTELRKQLTELQKANTQSSEQAPYQSLLKFSLGLMANKNPRFGVAVGEAGQLGLEEYSRLQELNKRQKEKLFESEAHLANANDLRSQNQYAMADKEARLAQSARLERFQLEQDVKVSNASLVYQVAQIKAGIPAEKAKMLGQQLAANLNIYTTLKGPEQFQMFKLLKENSGFEKYMQNRDEMEYFAKVAVTAQRQVDDNIQAQTKAGIDTSRINIQDEVQKTIESAMRSYQVFKAKQAEKNKPPVPTAG
jgi:hypothetical protein